MEAKQDVPSGLDGRKDIKTGHFTHIDDDDYKLHLSRPMTQINLAKWPTTALLRLTLRLAGPYSYRHHPPGGTEFSTHVIYRGIPLQGRAS